MPQDFTQFLGLPSQGPESAHALLLPIPVEKTVSYGTGTIGGPQAIIRASWELEPFDEETFVDFADSPRLFTLPHVSAEGEIEACLPRIRDCVRALRGKFLLSLGGEHLVTYGTVTGLVDDPSTVTVVQIDAHADLADELRERHWSHGTVMRRLWEQGCSLLQIGIRSLTSKEHAVASSGPRITTFYAHRMADQWSDILNAIRSLKGKVYLTIDVDGLDPSIIPSTGTPLPDGLSWRQTMDIVRVLATESKCDWIGADVVEFVPSAAPPGCDPVAARLVAKVLAWWWLGRRVTQ